MVDNILCYMCLLHNACFVLGGSTNNNDNKINSYIVPYGNWTDLTQQINSSARILHKHHGLESLEKQKCLPTLQHICAHLEFQRQ